MKVSEFKFTFTFMIGLIGIGVLVTTVFFTSIHFNPVQSEHNFKRLVYTLVPQGWAFFTRSPREAQTLIYRVTEKGALEQLHHLHSSRYNLIGLRRRATVYLSEIQLVRTQLTDVDFVDSEWNYQAGITGEFPKEKVKIENQMANPLLCGDYVLVFQKNIPWAWSKSIDQLKMPAKVARVEINCL